MADTLNPAPEATTTDDPGEQLQRPNWSALARFKEACEAADTAHSADLNHKEAVCEALRRTLCLIEDYRGDHKEEITTYLTNAGVKSAKLEKDEGDVLAIVQHVFARHLKQQHTWHANALKQAIAEGKTSDNLSAYFTKKSPTQAATEWRKAHPQGARKRLQPIEVPLTNLKLPTDFDQKKITDKGIQVKLCQKDGKFTLLIP